MGPSAALASFNLSHSLHGWFPAELYPAVKRIDFVEFNQSFPDALMPLDVTSMTIRVGCGQYREYVKHGAKSGYTYEHWLYSVTFCTVRTATYPHQCRFNGTHNVVQTSSDIELGTVGCVGGYKYVSNCQNHS